MRMICVDYGDARIGLAVCDETEMLASPLATIKSLSMRKNIDNVARIAHEEGAGRIVVGLPLNMDGTEGARANKTKAFGNVLAKVSGIDVVYFDERLSSVEAEYIMDMNMVGKNKRKDIVDRIAAQVILQSYLDSNNKKGVLK